MKNNQKVEIIMDHLSVMILWQIKKAMLVTLLVEVAVIPLALEKYFLGDFTVSPVLVPDCFSGKVDYLGRELSGISDESV